MTRSIVLVGLITGISATAFAQSSVKGRLLFEDNQPVADVSIKLCTKAKTVDGTSGWDFEMLTNGRWADVTTNADGTFVFPDAVRPDKYSLCIMARTAVYVITTLAGQILAIDVGKEEKRDIGTVVIKPLPR